MTDLFLYIFISCCFLVPLTDAELLTIKSKEENDFLEKSLSDDPLITTHVWLGVQLDSQGRHHHSKIFFSNILCIFILTNTDRHVHSEDDTDYTSLIWSFIINTCFSKGLILPGHCWKMKIFLIFYLAWLRKA